VFAGPFDAGLAHAVAAPPGTDPLDTLDLLSRLVDRSLVVAEQNAGVTRYRLSTRCATTRRSTRRPRRGRSSPGGSSTMVAEADRLSRSALSGGRPTLGAIVAQFRTWPPRPRRA
jgi:hypothetical protein